MQKNSAEVKIFQKVLGTTFLKHPVDSNTRYDKSSVTGRSTSRNSSQ